MQPTVYVLNKNGHPLMPTMAAKARILLKTCRARVKYREPFTIQLTGDSGGACQPITLGVDPGYKHVGLSASTKQRELFSAEAELRTDIAELISERKALRRSRRTRKTRHREPRFLNRVHRKKKGWLAPSVNSRVNAHCICIEKVCRILPVTNIKVEVAAFDMQKLKNPAVSGKEYQQGEQFGFWNTREYVLFRDGHVCQHCKGKSGDKILEVHHLESRRTGGNAPNNLITLCRTCHDAYHRGAIKLKVQRGKSYKDAAFMGSVRWELLKRFKAKYPELNLSTTYGYLTKHNRIVHNIAKTHCTDAFCIAGNFDAVPLENCYFLKQVRRHNRQIHKKKILKGGRRKLNQAPYLVHGFRLFDKVRCLGQDGFIYGRRSSGYFSVRRFDGTVIHAGISWKKLKLLSRRKSFLIEFRPKSTEDSSYNVQLK